MEHEHDIDDLFQKSFANFDVSPPDVVKQKIDEALFEKRKRRFFGLPSVLPLAAWLFGGISLIGGVILAILLLYKQDTKLHTKFLGSTAEGSTTHEELKIENKKLKPDNHRNGKSTNTPNHTLNTNSSSEKENTGNYPQSSDRAAKRQTAAHSSTKNETKTASEKRKNKKRKKRNGLSNPFFAEQLIAAHPENPENPSNDPDSGQETEKPDNGNPVEQGSAATSDSIAKAQKAAVLAKKTTVPPMTASPTIMKNRSAKSRNHKNFPLSWSVCNSV